MTTKQFEMDNVLANSTYDQLYEELLQLLKIGSLDRSNYELTVVGFLRYADLVDTNQAIANHSLFQLCNRLPAVGGAFANSGDLINSYALYLDYLVPNGMNAQDRREHADGLRRKLETEAKIGQLIRKSAPHVKTGSVASVQGSIQHVGRPFMERDVQHAQSLLASLKVQEEHLSRLGTQSLVPSDMTDRVPLFQAKGAVSMLTGARNISSKNRYNMPVNTNPATAPDTYAPYYGIKGLDAVFPEWTARKRDHIFPYHLQIRNQRRNLMQRGLERIHGRQASPYAKLKVFDLDIGMGREFGQGPRSMQFSVYSIDAKFSGLGLFEVGPENWFYPSLFKAKGYSLSSEAPNFFESGGSLEAIPISLLLGFNLDISIRFSTSAYKKFGTAIDRLDPSKNIGLSIGHLKFTITGQRKNVKLVRYNGSSTIQLSPIQVESPNLLGIISRKVKPYIQGSGPWHNGLDQKTEL